MTASPDDPPPDIPRPPSEELDRLMRIVRPYSWRLYDPRDQEEFLSEMRWRIWNRWPRILTVAEGDRRDPYVRTMARNLVSDMIEKIKGRDDVVGEPGQDRPGPDDTEGEALDKELVRRVARILNRFAATSVKNHAKAWAFVEHHYHGRPYRDLARELGLGPVAGPHTVRRWVKAVIAELRRGLEETPYPPDEGER